MTDRRQNPTSAALVDKPRIQRQAGAPTIDAREGAPVGHAGGPGAVASLADLRDMVEALALAIRAMPPAEYVRPVLTPATLRAWVVLRHGAWPPGVPPPNEDWWQAQANLTFGTRVPRSMLRDARRNKLPAEWLKRGPRGPRAR